MSDELPNGWESEPLGNLTTKIGSGATPRGGAQAYKSHGTPLIRSMNVHFDGFRKDGLAFLDDQQASALDGVTVRSHDVLLNITGASIGRVTIAPIEMDNARVNQHVCIIRPVEDIKPDFIARYLASPTMQDFIAGENYGVTRQALTKEMIEGIALPLPPAAEQHRIVAKIDSLFARSSRARGELAHIPRLIERYRQAVLEAAFRGDLTADWRESHSDQKVIELRQRLGQQRWERWRGTEIARLSAKGKPVDDTSLRRKYPSPAESDQTVSLDLPETWTVISLDELGWGSSYGTSTKCSYDAQGIPVARIPNVAKGVLDLDDIKFAIEDIGIAAGDEIAPGDLIVVRTNGSKDLVGRGAVVTTAPTSPTYFASYLIRFRLVGDDILRRWISLLWHSPLVRNQVLSHAATSAGQYNVSMTELAGFAIPLAPPDEMKLIVEQVESALVAIEGIEKEYEKAVALLPRMEASILDKAFTGKLVPQDPADEPASKLLDRIKAAREVAPKAKRGRRSAS